jgi:hypothetical protein
MRGGFDGGLLLQLPGKDAKEVSQTGNIEKAELR